MKMKMKMKKKYRSHRHDINRAQIKDTNIVNIKHDNACMYYATPKQHLKLSSWKSWTTLRLSWKKALLIKKRVSLNLNMIIIYKYVNPYRPSVVFHIETSHLFCRAKEMTGFYIKHNTGLKWVKLWQSWNTRAKATQNI